MDSRDSLFPDDDYYDLRGPRNLLVDEEQYRRHGIRNEAGAVGGRSDDRRTIGALLRFRNLNPKELEEKMTRGLQQRSGNQEKASLPKEMSLETVVDLMSEETDSMHSTADAGSSDRSSIATMMNRCSLGSSKPTKDHVIVKKEPEWSLIKTEPVTIMLTEMPKDADEVVLVDLMSPLGLIQRGRNIKMAKNPFAVGETRLSYYGMPITSYCDVVQVYGETCVLKKFIQNDASRNNMGYMMAKLEEQAIGRYLAKHFNKVKPKGLRDIEFYEASMLNFYERQSPAFFFMETKNDVEYKKFNNLDDVNDKKYHKVLQAFSHWSYDVTEGFLLVVFRLKGVKMGDSFQFTEPEIHCRDDSRFSKSNLGGDGMAQFFKNHACNHVCRKMKLKENPDHEGETKLMKLLGGVSGSRN